MTETCRQYLHITYNSSNTWGYPIWNAINAAIQKGRLRQLPDALRNEIGDLVLAVSVRLDYLPLIRDRINGGVAPLYEEIRQRDKAKDKYAYEPKVNVKYALLVDINSFLFEVYSGLAIAETLGKKLLRQVLGKQKRGSLLRDVLQQWRKSAGWLDKLEEGRHHFTHSGTPWIAICLDQEPKHDLLIMKENIHSFDDPTKFIRLSEFSNVLKGYIDLLMLLQQYLVHEVGQAGKTL